MNKVIILFFVIFFGITLSQNDKLHCKEFDKVAYKEWCMLILKNIKIGSHNLDSNYKISGDLLKKLLLGFGQIGEYESVEFFKNGTFKVMDWEDGIDRGRFVYRGKWSTEDNTILFKSFSSTKWQKCRVEKTILKKMNKKFVKYDYSISLKLEKVYFGHRQFLGGWLGNDIYLEKEEAGNKKKNDTKKQVPQKKK